jgi:hypothetical protein
VLVAKNVKSYALAQWRGRSAMGLDRRTRRNHFSSTALSITDHLLRRSEPPSSTKTGTTRGVQPLPLYAKPSHVRLVCDQLIAPSGTL